MRLEPLFGGTRVDADAARALAEAGRRVIGRMARMVPADARGDRGPAPRLSWLTYAPTHLRSAEPGTPGRPRCADGGCGGGCSTLCRDPERSTPLRRPGIWPYMRPPMTGPEENWQESTGWSWPPLGQLGLLARQLPREACQRLPRLTPARVHSLTSRATRFAPATRLPV